ncbi:fimbrial protein [Xenorhabdus japonica]|uniref:Pilin (Type 1 fimbria component protein) n=1 Tax=Xenorhabdus japonica TaxID=53341 RepID=A0A1I5BQ52_9GAMM|nr:fimbrial protein [Xenorhabdus japonica]SFN76904.1 Pilin (type 1 fimbria component protein) [Xenorhabdus japonica]
MINENPNYILQSLIILLGLWLPASGNAGKLPIEPNPNETWVHVSGSVVSTSCTIVLEDAWQSLNMGVISAKNLNQDSVGNQKNVVIKLTHCSLAKQSNAGYQLPVKISFEGQRDTEPHWFYLSGNAQGAVLTIHDSKGYLVREGEILPTTPIYGNGQQLKYKLSLISNGKPLLPGHYYAALRFKINYE